jgi:dTDP-4-dehydrorhamnose reductase
MKTLVLGDGRLATEICKQTSWDYISRKKNGFDFTSIDTYKHLLEGYNQIVNCIAYTKTYEAERKLNWDINFLGVIQLTDYCKKTGKKLVHISTDYVYANSVNVASEDDVPASFNTWYSYTKLLGDGYVQAILDDYLLIRTTFKPRPFPWKKAWNSIVGNFDYIDVITKLVIEVIEKNAVGVYNVGTEPKTYHDLAIQTVPDCVADSDMFIHHPSDVTMNLKKMKDLLWKR